MRRPGQWAKTTISGGATVVSRGRRREDLTGVLKLDGGSMRLETILSTTSATDSPSTGARRVRMA